MLKVYHSPQTRSSRLIWLLEEVGADYQIEYVTIRRQDGSGAPDPANKHPSKQVPAIEHNGQVICESPIIFSYVCELYPKAGLAPRVGDPKRAEFVSWLGLYAAVLEPVITAKFRNPDGLTDTQAAAYDALHAAWTNALRNGSYMLGEEFTAIDILFGSLLMFFRSSMPEAIIYDQWVERISQRPALIRSRYKDAPPN